MVLETVMCLGNKTRSYTCTRSSRRSTGSHWALLFKQKPSQTLNHSDSQWGRLRVRMLPYHWSRHRHGRGFVIITARHLRGEVLERETETELNQAITSCTKLKTLRGSAQFHISGKCETTHTTKSPNVLYRQFIFNHVIYYWENIDTDDHSTGDLKA